MRRSTSKRSTWPGRLLLRLLLVMVMLLGSGAVFAVPARAADIIALSDNTAILPPAAVTQVSFPVTPAGSVNLATAQLRILRLSRDQVELAIPDGFRARIDTQFPALVLIVPADKLPNQGSYDVLLAIQAGSARQLVTVTLTRSAAQVAAPPTIAVSRTTSWLWGTASKKPRLTLVTSADTRLLTLSARQIEAEDPQVTVHISQKSLPVPPNGSVVLPYDVIGAPGPATITRTVMLSSPQLSTPISVTFTITTRRHPALIAIALLAGVLLSLLLRRMLPTLTNWRKEQSQRQDLDEQLAAWRDQYQDPDFREEIEEQRTTLRNAKSQGLAAVISTVRTEATEDLQHLQTRLTGQQAAFSAATEVFRREWRLPPDPKTRDDDALGIRDAVNRARAALDQADGELAVKNAKAAHEALTRVNVAASGTSAAARGWGEQVRQGIGEMVRDLESYDSGALASLKTALGPTVQGAPAETASTSGSGADSDPVQDAGSRLREVHATMERYAAARPYFETLAGEADEVARGLTNYGRPAGRVPEAAKELRDTDSAQGGDPAIAGRPVAAAVRKLIAATSKAIEDVRVGNKAAVEDRLNRGDLVGAADEALAQQPPPAAAAAGRTRLGSSTQAALAVARSTAATQEHRDPAVVLAGARAPITSQLRSLPSATTLALAGFAAEGLHVIAAVVIVLFTGYALFLPNWTGTYADLVQVVTWAFGGSLRRRPRRPCRLAGPGVITGTGSLSCMAPATGRRRRAAHRTFLRLRGGVGLDVRQCLRDLGLVHQVLRDRRHQCGRPPEFGEHRRLDKDGRYLLRRLGSLACRDGVPALGLFGRLLGGHDRGGVIGRQLGGQLLSVDALGALDHRDGAVGHRPRRGRLEIGARLPSVQSLTSAPPDRTSEDSRQIGT